MPVLKAPLSLMLLAMLPFLSSPSIGAGGSALEGGMMNEWWKPPGELHEVFGYPMHLDCRGKGQPVVVLEAGMGAFSIEWIHVQEELAKLTQVCSYDRAGYGWSDPSPYPRSIDRLVEELHELLAAAQMSSPYILVGHSFGGFSMIRMANAYPNLATALILVDSSHPDQFESLLELPKEREKRHIMEILPNRRQMSFVSHKRVQRLYPEGVAQLVLTLMGQPKAVHTYRRESQMFRYNGALLKRDWKLPVMPLRVISRGRKEWGDSPRGQRLESAWLKMQRSLSGLSPDSRFVVALGSGHMVPLERPDVVVREIRELVQEWRVQCALRQVDALDATGLNPVDSSLNCS